MHRADRRTEDHPADYWRAEAEGDGKADPRHRHRDRDREGREAELIAERKARIEGQHRNEMRRPYAGAGDRRRCREPGEARPSARPPRPGEKAERGVASE